MVHSTNKGMSTSNRRLSMNRATNHRETSDVITFGEVGTGVVLPGLLIGLPASLIGLTLIPIVLKPFASALNDTFAGAAGEEVEVDRRK